MYLAKRQRVPLLKPLTLLSEKFLKNALCSVPVQNRLEHTIANLGTSAENLQAAESRIRDLDMAEEIMAFTKNNILQQAATAMLAQANMAPQSVLQLLG
jgi:flagellin-like hook-associated protein FlgL